MAPPKYVFTRLHLPRPLEASGVEQLLARLTSSDTPRPLVFELRAIGGEIVYLVGHQSEHTTWLKQVLADYVPGVLFDIAPARRAVAATGHLTARPDSLPLRTGESDRMLFALHSALARRREDELVVMQLIVGQRRRPSLVPLDLPDPNRSSLYDVLVRGTQHASADVRRRVAERDAQPRLIVTARIGVEAATAERRQALAQALFGALQTMEAPGVRMLLVRDKPEHLDSASPRSHLGALTPSELLPFLGWPVGEMDLPGLPPLHPRRLAGPASLEDRAAVFAQTTAPGKIRDVGIDPTSRLSHLVVTGPTGSGKSIGVFAPLILSDITARRPVVLIEPKRQLVDYVIDHAPKEAAGRIVVIDAADARPVGFNPLDVGDRDPDVVVDGILASLQAVFEDGWGPRTEYLIQGGLLSLARAGVRRGEPYTLVDLPRLLTDQSFRREVIEHLDVEPTLDAFWSEYEALSPGQHAAWTAPPLNKLRKLVLRKHLVAVLGQPRPRFRLRDLFRDGDKAVLVPLNDALIGSGAAKLLGSLIVAELWLATKERAQEMEPAWRPGYVFIDEVQNYLHLPTSIADALATSRSYGVGWHVAHQFRGQLGPNLKTAFDVNARSKVCFALGADDARDMAKLAPELGAEDFQQLPPYEVYAALMTSAGPSRWFSARTIAPTKRTGHGELIRRASRQLFGGDPGEVVVSSPTAQPGTDDAPRTKHQKPRRS
jgi:Type IV secretory pathway, VirD4 components